MLNRPQIKADARLLIRTAAVSPLMMSAIVLLIVFLLDRVSDLAEYGSLFYSYTYNAAYLDALLAGNVSALPDALPALVGDSPEIPSFFSVLVSLFTTILYGGYYAYCLGIHRGVRMPYSTLLDGLSVSGKLIWCSIQMTVKIILWSLLFLFPGIIATYRYRFAYYNILSDPTMTASDAIRLSCRQTMGMKGELFLLDLSFLGWLMLPAILSAFLGLIGLYPVVVASFLLDIWLTPYTSLCDVAYFEEARRRLAPPPPPVWNNTNY